VSLLRKKNVINDDNKVITLKHQTIMEKEVTSRNTKKQIFQAYEEVIKKLKELKSQPSKVGRP